MTANIFLLSTPVTLERLSWIEECLKFFFIQLYPETLIHQPKGERPAFTFLVTDPSLDGSGDVIHYEVPNIIQASGLEHLPSLDYLAIDLKPNPHLASAMPWGTEQWLNACPYYRLIYVEGDIRVYEVDTSVLP